jgi:ATP-dependent Lon protease
MNNHNMNTRSKTKDKIINNPDNDSIDEDDSEIDEYGNLKNFIDYDCDDDFDVDEFNNQIFKLSKGKINKTSKIKKNNRKNNKNIKKNNKINDLLMSYLIMKATEKANKKLKSKKKIKNKIKIQEQEQEQEQEQLQEQLQEQDDNIIKIKKKKKKNNNNNPSIITILNADFNDSDSDDSSYNSIDYDDKLSTPEITTSDEDKNTESDNNSETNSYLSEKKSEKESEESEEEYSFEYDDLDEKYEELIDKQLLLNSEESNMEYYHNLSQDKKNEIYNKTENIYKFNGDNKPLRFKIIDSDMNMKTKAIALENIDKLSEMDVSTGEHSKMNHWINGLMKIPFGIYNKIPINDQSSIQDKRNYIQNTYKILNKAIYGHKEAKTHILQVIGKWIKNSSSGGNVLAIQGPMGNGKTTLVKEGISKVLNRPFAFIALGGASDSAFFDGHCFTYEGAHWGRIVQILQDSKCMNPVFYFDELDKLSDTAKGDEITHMLTHLTDPSQNSLFQDNYFPGINLDLSKALFIFSYNDESKVNKILKDRMYVINTKGFNINDKLKITRDYLLPEIYNIFMFKNEDFIFSDEIIKNIVQNHTQNEDGVRNLKRCLETIISKINIHILSNADEDLSFKLENINLPINIEQSHIDILLKSSIDNNKTPFGMYC